MYAYLSIGTKKAKALKLTLQINKLKILRLSLDAHFRREIATTIDILPRPPNLTVQKI